MLATLKLDKNEVAGTPLYMAPETVFEQKITFASDIWALGCVLYELCQLRHPFAFAKVKSLVFSNLNFQLTKFSLFLAYQTVYGRFEALH